MSDPVGDVNNPGMSGTLAGQTFDAPNIGGGGPSLGDAPELGNFGDFSFPGNVGGIGNIVLNYDNGGGGSGNGTSDLCMSSDQLNYQGPNNTLSSNQFFFGWGCDGSGQSLLLNSSGCQGAGSCQQMSSNYWQNINNTNTNIPSDIPQQSWVISGPDTGGSAGGSGGGGYSA
jgi:hypothetical protein